MVVVLILIGLLRSSADSRWVRYFWKRSELRSNVSVQPLLTHQILASNVIASPGTKWSEMHQSNSGGGLSSVDSGTRTQQRSKVIVLDTDRPGMLAGNGWRNFKYVGPESAKF